MSFFSGLLSALPGAVAQGLIWGLMAIGVFITFKVLHLADLTVDGTMATAQARRTSSAPVHLCRQGIRSAYIL